MYLAFLIPSLLHYSYPRHLHIHLLPPLICEYTYIHPSSNSGETVTIMFSPIRGNASSFPSLMIVNEQYPSLASHSELIDKIEKAQELPLDSSHWQESGLVPPHQNLDSLCMNSLSEKQTDRLAKEDAFPGESAIGDILTGHTVWVVPNWKDDQTWLALQITHTLKVRHLLPCEAQPLTVRYRC